MKISDLMSTDFSIVDAAWSRKRALEAASALDAGYVVIRKALRSQRPSEYYLLGLDEFRRRLQEALNGRVSSIIGLSALDPTPTLAKGAVVRAITQAIVLERGKPVGVVAAPPAAAGRRRGFRATRESAQPPETPALLPRTLIGEMPSALKVGTVESLAVTLTARAAAGANAGNVALPAGARIDVIVRADAPLAIKGDASASFTVAEPQPDDVRTFRVTANKPGPGRVHVYAFHGGLPLVVLEVTTEAVDALPAAVPPPVPARTEIAMSPQRDLELSLHIFERGEQLEFYLDSADKRFNFTPFPPMKVNAPRVYFQEFFRSIERLPPEEAQDGLRERGLNLFRSAMPKELRKALWSVKDSVRTLQINSDEPWIPWEVCKLEGLVDGTMTEGPFFAEAFNVTRWFTGVSAVPRIPLGNIALIVPGNSGLTSAPDEKEYVESLQDGARRVANIAARKKDVKSAMGSAKFDAWHFTGHAQAPVTVNANDAPIELENEEKLTPDDIVGTTSNLLKTRPFIFFNACQSARGGLALTGSGGWAQRFIKDTEELPTAAAFVGTYWQVDDDKALAFAKALYAQLIKGTAIGDAAHAARRAAQSASNEPYDTSWLAYTVYAAPWASVA